MNTEIGPLEGVEVATSELMPIATLRLPTRRGENRIPELESFSQRLIEIGELIGFKLSSRGWCYQLEGFGYINKGQFNRVQKVINECRIKGFLPIDFVAEEESRQFSCVNVPTRIPPNEFLASTLRDLLELEKWYEPDYWSEERYYLQMLVEKIDLKTLFLGICERYHVPIATSKGWSSISQRAEIASRYKIAELRGQRPVLLYCGDHDPWGLAISDQLKENFEDISMATEWSPDNLVFDRFGLNYDFIQELDLTWIDNLISGSGREPDRSNPIVRDYIARYGERKVEANAIVVRPIEARDLCKSAIERYLGPDALQRFQEKERLIAAEFERLRERIGLPEYFHGVLEVLS